MCITWPVTYDESSLAKYINNGAISYGCPALPIGASEPRVGIFWVSQHVGCSGVQNTLGDTAFTLIFLDARLVTKDL